MRNSYLEYIIPAGLALVICILLIRFIPVLSTSYLLKLEEAWIVAPDDYKYYFDLDGDGASEVFSIYMNSSNNLAISIASLKQATINQFNLPGKLTNIGATLDLHDINGDGVMDIFVCSEKNDSLFLTIIDNLFGHPTTTQEYFLDLINQYNDNGDYLYVPGEITDLTGDGFPEYVFAINGGHALQPRRVYAIDYQHDHIMKSPVSGAAVVSIDCFDLDSDGRDEILLNTVAPENFKSNIPYRDSITWMMVLDESLQFYRSPIAMNKPPSWISMEPFIHNDRHYVMTYHRYRNDDDYNAVLTIYNDSLQPVKSRLFTGQLHNRYHLWRVPGGLDLTDIKLFGNAGVYSVDMDLHLKDSILNQEQFGYNVDVQLDIDADGEREYVFLGNYSLNVFRSDLRESGRLDMLWNERNPRTLISRIENGNAYPVLFVQIGNEQFTLRYFKNGWYQKRVLVYPGMFILLFGLFYLWVFFQNRMVSKRYEKDKLISQLQLQSIKNQLDPHFTYNALNAVGSLIYKGEKELAYQYLKGLTDLLRMVSGDSDQVTWTLYDELEFVIKYLEIEKLRFREKFNYEIMVEEEGLKELQVPKMSILTFVENSIKHGLRHKEYDRKLEIRISGLASGMKIEVQDNGIGRAAAGRYQQESTGHGIRMMKQYFKQFNKATGRKARFEVKDLFEYDLKAAGTLVEIIIK